jgi:3-methyl-2-oxobutanoate hydroxymethyltransferase
MKKATDFEKMKKDGLPISVITCYDYWSAKIINQSNIDMILVGDSLAMVMHGHKNTIPATVDLMVTHTESVLRGATDKFIVTDLPFLSYRKGMSQAIDVVHRVMEAGAHAVKLEGAAGNLELIAHLVESGIPVMGHVGLVPQSVHRLGGFKTQGITDENAEYILESAISLEKAGCFSIVLECIPATLGQTITNKLKIPTIGIGAGPHVSGQVLVLHDLLGLNDEFKPKFAKQYLNGLDLIKCALNDFDDEVKKGAFPTTTNYKD